MHFFAKLVTALPAIAGVASAAVIPRAVDSATMLSNLDDLTTRSKNTDDLAKQISYVNINSYPTVINSLSDLIKQTSQDVTVAQGTEPFTDESAQQQVCDAFDTFVKVQQAMLATLTGKAAMTQSTPFSAPLAAALRALEGADDSFSFQLIDTVPSCQTDATADKTKLDKSLQQAIDAYSGF